MRQWFYKKWRYFYEVWSIQVIWYKKTMCVVYNHRVLCRSTMCEYHQAFSMLQNHLWVVIVEDEMICEYNRA